jgi:hypothetical protein
MSAEQEAQALNIILTKNMIGKIKQSLFLSKMLKPKQLLLKKQTKAKMFKNKSQTIFQSNKIRKTKINSLMRVEDILKGKINMKMNNAINSAKLR